MNETPMCWEHMLGGLEVTSPLADAIGCRSGYQTDSSQWKLAS
jgi:hypothetical protein